MPELNWRVDNGNVPGFHYINVAWVRTRELNPILQRMRLTDYRLPRPQW